MSEYIAMWKNYVNFSDRTNRRGYWMSYLVSSIISIIILIISVLIDNDVLITLYCLAASIPNLSLTVRRLRDAGKSWTWFFISFIPLVGAIWLIILLCGESVESDDYTMVV